MGGYDVLSFSKPGTDFSVNTSWKISRAKFRMIFFCQVLTNNSQLKSFECISQSYIACPVGGNIGGCQRFFKSIQVAAYNVKLQVLCNIKNRLQQHLVANIVG